MLTDEEVTELVGRARELSELLGAITGRYRPGGDTSHSWHMDWLDRASLLGAQLQAALDLEAGRAYPAAFSIIRTALEHHLIDRLIVLGHQWRQEVRVPPPKDPDEYETQLQAAEARGTIVGFTRTSERRFLVVRKAPHFENDPDEWISTYSEWAEHYNPFSGPPNVQDQLIGAFMDVADRTRLARESHELRERVFSFRALREHLDLNGLLGQSMPSNSASTTVSSARSPTRPQLATQWYWGATDPDRPRTTTIARNCWPCMHAASPVWRSEWFARGWRGSRSAGSREPAKSID